MPRRTILDSLDEETCVLHLPLWWPGGGLPQPQGSSTTSIHGVSVRKTEVHGTEGYRMVVSETINLWNLQNALWAHKCYSVTDRARIHQSFFQYQLAVSMCLQVFMVPLKKSPNHVPAKGTRTWAQVLKVTRSLWREKNMEKAGCLEQIPRSYPILANKPRDQAKWKIQIRI